MLALDVLVFLLVLGVLVFVHELGHFVAAKACGIYCNRFSLGMPPRLFGITLGETDYCVGALPFGGYVKMAGQEDAPMTEEERQNQYSHVPPERWLFNKPPWQRFIVFAAGPSMNFVLAVVLYALRAAVGAEVPETQVDNRIGAIRPASPAAHAPMYLAEGLAKAPDLEGPPDTTGWQTGDRILSIDRERIDNITDVAMAAVLSTGKVLRVEVERTAPDGHTTRYISPVEPVAPEGDELPRFGVAPFETAVVLHVHEDMPGHEMGIRPGDIITTAKGKWVDMNTFIKLIEAVPEGETVDIELERDAETVPITIQPRTVGRMLDVAFAPWPGSKTDRDNALPLVVGVSHEVAKEAGILPRDVILEVNGMPATVAMLTRFTLEHPGETVVLSVRRPAILHGLLRKETTETIQFEISPVRAIGVELRPKIVFYRVPPLQVLPEAFRQGYRDVARVMKTLAMLITGKVSPRNLGGPMMIYQATTMAAQAGFWWLTHITAFISVNLCIFNLLPLPVLDGGQILLLGVEQVRRKPVPIRVVERFQQVGLVLIVALMLYVTYNDILRWITNLVP